MTLAKQGTRLAQTFQVDAFHSCMEQNNPHGCQQGLHNSVDVSTTTLAQLRATREAKLHLTLANMQINGHLWAVPRYPHIHLERRC